MGHEIFLYANRVSVQVGGIFPENLPLAPPIWEMELYIFSAIS